MATPREGVARGTVAGLAVAGLAVAGAIMASADPFTFMFFASYMAVGGFLAIRRPRNAVGWLLVGIAFGFIATTTTPFVDTAALVRGDASARDNLIAWVGGWGGTALFFGFLALTVVFPNGRLPGDGGRRTSILLLAAGVAVVVLTAVAPTLPVTLPDGTTNVDVPNPVAVLPDLPVWSAIPGQSLWLVAVVLLAIGVVRMVLRSRRATGMERLQLRWLVAAVVFVFVALVAGLVIIAVLGEEVGGFAWIPAIIAYPTIPLAVGVAVMRYRLLEIDRIISRTIGWTLVTGVLVVTFAGGVIALQSALSGFVRGQTLAVAASTLVAFALFQPVRRRVQAVVDRRFDRARYDGERTAAAFAGRLRDQVDLVALEADVIATVGVALRPTSTSVWLKPSSRPTTHTTTP